MPYDARPPQWAPLAILTIDIDAVVANWRRLSRLAGGAECAAVLKADAYGLGADMLAPALADAGCRSFFVAHASEGASLRACLDAAGHAKARIFILHGVQEGEIPNFARHRLIPVLSTLRQIALWRAAGEESLPAALQVDSGMNRLGLPPAVFHDLAAPRGGLDDLHIVLLLSHLACADDPADPMSRRQLDRFLAMRRLVPEIPASLANSAGIFHGADFAFELVRPGIGLHGIDPIKRNPADNPLQSAVALQARILQLREIDPAEVVGYGAAFRAAQRTRLATVSLGYADGYLRALSGRGVGAIDGVRVPLAGRVSMDMLTFDISALPAGAVQEGDFLELAGPTVSIDELAREGGTIGYEILTRLGSRLARRYRKGGDVVENEPSSLHPTVTADVNQ